MFDQDAQFGVERPFATLLRKARTQAGLTRKALAERAGLSEQAIGSLECGRRRYPYPHTVSALASALNVSPAEQREWPQAASPEPMRLSLETKMAARNEARRPPHTHDTNDRLLQTRYPGWQSGH